MWQILREVAMDARSPQKPPAGSGKAEAAEYIALEMSRLARMASANDFPLLPYLIDMAVLEAWREASEPQGNGGSPRTAE
jgi:hypothetical protein